MLNLQSAFHLVIICISLTHVCGQIDSKFQYSTNNQRKQDGSTYVVPFSEPPDTVSDDTMPKDDSISQIPMELLEQISSLANVSEFIEHFVDKESIDPRDNILNYGSEGMERSAGIMPKPAGCIPTDTLVTLRPDEPQEANILYFPTCTRVKRCNGCCAHALISCQPIETETLTFQVTKTQFTGGTKMAYRGKAVVLVEQHKRCKCDCRKKASDCNSFQRYIVTQCRCACQNTEDKEKCQNSTDKIWDPDNCLCRCQRIHECTTGTFFDETICGCSPVSRADRKKFIIKPTYVNPDKK